MTRSPSNLESNISGADRKYYSDQKTHLSKLCEF